MPEKSDIDGDGVCSDDGGDSVDAIADEGEIASSCAVPEQIVCTRSQVRCVWCALVRVNQETFTRDAT